MPEKNPRLRPDDWIAAGLAALEAAGRDALAAEPLARALGTTKGSFYWHFRDVPAFRRAVVEAWQARALAAIAAAPETHAHADRLRALSRPDRAEAAMRAWAQGDAEVARTVERVDAERRAAIAATLAGLGLTNPEFARIIQAAVIGMEAMGDTTPLSTLLAAILALQEA